MSPPLHFADLHPSFSQNPVFSFVRTKETHWACRCYWFLELLEQLRSGFDPQLKEAPTPPVLSRSKDVGIRRGKGIRHSAAAPVEEDRGLIGRAGLSDFRAIHPPAVRGPRDTEMPLPNIHPCPPAPAVLVESTVFDHEFCAN